MAKHYDESLFVAAIDSLIRDDRELLRSKYPDHELKGERKGYRELHATGDWLVIYRTDHEELVLVLIRTGSHDELFG